MLNGLSEAALNTGDVISVGVVVGTVAQILPSVAVALTIIWTAIRIGEWCWQKWTLFRDRNKNEEEEKGGH